MHDVEAWSEAIGEGAWGKRFKPLGEKVGGPRTSITGPASSESYRELEQLIIDLASGRCGEPPDTIVMFGGDVHHCYLSEVGLPAESGTVHSKVWHAVCSGLRKELQLSERLVLGFGHTWIAAKLGRLLAAAADVRPPRLSWRMTTRPRFRNQIGTLEIAGRRGRAQDRAGDRQVARAAAPVIEKLL